MAVIETKYSIGDVVYCAGTTTTRKQHPCPDCLGERKWKAVSPAGSEYDFACPRCAARYNSERDLALDYTAHVASVRRLTIGSVQFNSAPGSYDTGARYMCCETGVGSGSVYNEDRLFATEAEALAASEIMAKEADKSQEWCAKQYDRSLEVSDYQLEHAMMKDAKDFKSRAGSLLYNIHDLFDAINEAGDKDAILEAVDDYKRWNWERDLKKLASDTDGSPQGTDPQGLDGEAATAGAEGIAQ